MTVILPIHEVFKVDEPEIEAGTGKKTSGTVSGTVNGTVKDVVLPFNLANRIVGNVAKLGMVWDGGMVCVWCVWDSHATGLWRGG